jgi:putative transposase
MRVSDNGTELTGMAMLRWSQEMLIECATSRPASCSKTLLSRVSMAGSGTDSSMRRYSHHSHRSAILAAWKNDYNTVRPHSALANFTPIEYADRCTPNRNGADRCATPGERGRPAPLLHRAHSLEAFQLAIANSDLAGTCNLLRRRNDLRRHSSAPRQLPARTTTC